MGCQSDGTAVTSPGVGGGGEAEDISLAEGPRVRAHSGKNYPHMEARGGNCPKAAPKAGTRYDSAFAALRKPARGLPLSIGGR